MYTFKKDINIKEYNEFIKKYKYASFMQEKAWALVKNNWDNILCGVYEKKVLVAACSILIRKLRKGFTMFYIPRGYLIDFENKELLKFMTENIKILAKKYKAYIVKIDPNFCVSEKFTKNKNLSFDVLSHNYNIKHNNLLNLGYIHQGFSKNLHANLQPRYQMAIPLINDNNEKIKQKNNFTKLTHKRGISLIVLIVTIIVIIILAAAVILTITKNNPVSSAKEATFKEDMSNIQDELSMYISKKYTDDPLSFEKSSVNLSGDSMVTELPSTKKYKEKVSVVEGNLVLNYSKVNSDEKKWFNEVIGNTSNVKEEWQDTIASVKYGVPIPKGFTYKEGTKDTGLVIQDSNENEFVWVPATESTYAKDTSFLGPKPTGDDTLPNGITDETADVKKYGGFYIGRYELSDAGVQKDKPTLTDTDWYHLYNACKDTKLQASDKVKTQMIWGCQWDVTMNWLISSGAKTSDGVNKNSSTWGNYEDSTENAKVTVTEEDGTTTNKYGRKQNTGYSEYWKANNIYDLAGNCFEWTQEAYSTNSRAYRGGYCDVPGSRFPASYRDAGNPADSVYGLRFSSHFNNKVTLDSRA